MAAFTPYRVAHKEEEILLSVGAGTWWMRTRLQLPFLRRVALLMAAIIGALAAVAIGFVFILGAPSSWLPPMLAVPFAMWLLPMFLVVFVTTLRALDPSLLDLALPAALVMRPATIHVVPRRGEPFDSKWAFIHAYRVTSSRIVLVLSRDPHLRIEVANETLSAEGRKKLVGWLETERVPKDD